jgi:SAM-dependent methyltransferase
MKKHAPATLRNREAILDVLHDELPESGLVLEVASGSGEHIVYFAERVPHLYWQPSDVAEDALASIMAYVAEYPRSNLRLPLVLDAQAPAAWEMREADAIICINMIHISPWAAIEGLFEGAARILRGKNVPLILYGPFFEQGAEPAPSNVAFDESLRSRNERWGIREVEALDGLASANGFARTARHEMPANNLTLVYRRT